MSFYQDIFYGDGFYGEGDVAGPDVPIELAFYRTNTDNVYVFHWGFQEIFITPNIVNIGFDLEIDTVNTFDGPDYQTFDQTTALTYQNGNVRKGAAIMVNLRQDGTEQTWYWRVRTKSGFIPSLFWSNTAQFTILKKFEVAAAEALLNNLPDYHVYGKSDLRRAVGERSSKLYKICNMYGKEFDQSELENILTTTNNYISLCRDEQLFQNFGYFFSYIKPQQQTAVEYRNALKNLLLGSLQGGTFSAIRRVVKSFTGVTPILQAIKDRNEFFLSTILEDPIGAIDGVNTSFLVSQEYTAGTLVVLLNGVPQDPGQDFQELPFEPGFTMTVAPMLGDVITVVFDIGDRTDPLPVVLDLTDRAILTGSFNFEHGSRILTGSGTLFTTEVQPGMILVDTEGMAFVIVESIQDDENLTAKNFWVGATSTGAGYKLNYNSSRHITGEVTFNTGSNIVNGFATAFTNEIAVGNTIMDDYGNTGIVDSITNDGVLVLTANWAPVYVPITNQTSVNARILTYDDMVTWGKSALASGLVIQVLNPGHFNLPRPLLEMLVKLLIPAHVLVYFEYEF